MRGIAPGEDNSTAKTDRLAGIQAQLKPLRQELLAHPIYSELRDLSTLHFFMQHHVFAVWDFMSLLKSLQQSLCCVSVPWLPPTHREGCRLVNEIVLGEESDEDGAGSYSSHFDLYHRAMQRCGASTIWIDRFLAALRGGKSLATSMQASELPRPIVEFVEHTFSLIDGGDICTVASAFTFGREDLLPDVFQRIVDELSAIAGSGLADFQFYLARHIQLDGDDHGPKAARLIESLCGTDPAKWQLVLDAAVSSLNARKRLWDGVLAAIPGR